MVREKPKTMDGSSGAAMTPDRNVAGDGVPPLERQTGHAPSNRTPLPYDTIDSLLAGLTVIGLACLLGWVLLRLVHVGLW